MLLLLSLACAPDAPVDTGGLGPLVDPSAWVLDLDAPDPLADHRPDDATCSPANLDIEYGGIEIDTTACTYVQLVQPLLSPIEQDEPLHIVAWHQDLAALEPAQAHLALLIDGQLLWEEFADIPSAAWSWDLTVPAPAAAQPGATVLLHLHNHGANTWNVAAFERAHPED